ncbi:UBN2_3 domain-containing protein [Cephalotus follicularis]|uniref:UBN2_3 domain-containing protein n=1 Tax=Cephalotus follicularis TaxID=3775 RepID=A0A1Q3BP43_CEPFO|nr:UBN2_3 domain-containing protein [Cephalotus follicularis]
MADPNSPTSKSPSTDASLHLNVPSSSTTAFTPSSPTNFTNIHHFLSIKLTSTNYLIWRSQFLPLLNGYDLMQFVDGSSSPPPRNLSSAPADTPVLNPDFLAWYKQDQLLLSWILSSLTESVHAQVVGEEIRAQSALMHLSNASAHTATKTSNPDSRQNRSRGRGSSARRGRGRSNSHFPTPHSSYLAPHPLCQICNQPRHSALNCPQRFCSAEPTRANAAFTDNYPPHPQ